MATIGMGGVGCTMPSGNLIFKGGGGSNASGSYSTVGGVIQSINVVSNGFGYVSLPTVSVEDSNCRFYAINVTLFDPLLAGVTAQVSTYTANRVVTLSTTLPAPTTSTTSYSISPPVIPGVSAVRVSGYIFSPDPNTAFSMMLDSNSTTVGGRGFDAWFLGSTIEISDSRVQSLNLIAPGSGCVALSGNLTFVGGGGVGAAGIYTVSNGAVASVVLTSLGSFYSSAPTVGVTDPSCTGVVVTAAMSNSTSFGNERPVMSLISMSSGQVVTVKIPFSSSPTLSTSFNLRNRIGGTAYSDFPPIFLNTSFDYLEGAVVPSSSGLSSLQLDFSASS
eukprot:CAMPEP_0172202548 /NCGR_PEP_ID=MMETSP1050-20130122/30725_1 /TAXON_ID=233186 /ORGANISM="Cryptomonas curvata, Strain CCAP979/52" /LENGTH=332 /DNA_ID=CAMNT_0012880535 /DNA_START=107 /DNA_END=1102 /DNA_ORIENTATION=+